MIQKSKNNNPSKNHKMPDNIKFIHFDNKNICQEFIKYANNKSIKIGHECCSGKGCAIYDKDSKQIDEIRNSFLNEIPKLPKIIKIEIENECSICLENTQYVTKICNHYLCNTCETQVIDCPICRRYLYPLLE